MIVSYSVIKGLSEFGIESKNFLVLSYGGYCQLFIYDGNLRVFWVIVYYTDASVLSSL